MRMRESWLIVLMLFDLQMHKLVAINTNLAVDRMISTSLKASVRPCEDFYDYACGNYNKQIFFSASMENKNLLAYANHQYNTEIINILDMYGRQQHYGGEECATLTEKVRNYYEACRKVSLRNLTRYLEELKPGPYLNWPILENKSGKRSIWPHGQDFDVFYLLGKLRSLGMTDVIADTFYFPDNEIVIEPPRDPSALPKKQRMLSLLSLVGVRDDEATKIAEDVLKINRKWLDLFGVKENNLNAKIETNLGDLVKLFPKLNFNSYLMEGIGIQLPLNTTILLYNPSFFHELNDNMWSAFDKTKLCSYLMIKYLQFLDATTEFNAKPFCLDELRRMFNLAVNFLYYQHNIDYHEQFVKPDVTEIFKTVRDMLSKHLQSHDLKLPIEHMHEIIKDLSQTHLNIGNLPANASCDEIEALYSSVPALDENNYYKNHLLMLSFMRNRTFTVHFQATEPELPHLPAIFFDRMQQIITLNYAYLLPPVYDFDYNNLAKYSLLGFALAQKLIKKTGIAVVYRIISDPLFSATECLRGTSPYELLDYRVQDNLASEIVRKIVTLKFLNTQPIETLASWKKYFFLNVAQHYCGNETTVVYDSKNDRLNRIAMNSEEFSQAFNCSTGSKMNPIEKCKI